MDIETGAENNIATVPPTDSTNQMQVPASFTDAMRQSVNAEVEDQQAQTDANAVEVGTQQAEDTTQPENVGTVADPNAETAAASAEREKFIPRERFDQVNARAQELEQTIERERQSYQQREEQIALAQRAVAAGYADVNAYQRDDAWAKTNNFTDIEEAIELNRYNAELQPKVDNGEMAESLRAELVRDKQERMRERQELQQVRGLLRTVQATTLDQTIATVKARFEGVDPAHWAAAEKVFREVDNPQGVMRLAETFAPMLEATRKTAAEKAVIDHNARRAANSNGAPSAEGRGGGQPPVQVPNMTPQDVKRRSFSELLGFYK